MLIRLFILFAVISVIELYLLIKVGSLIGALPTVVLVLSISMAGAWLVRHQRFGILRRIQAELAQGSIEDDVLGALSAKERDQLQRLLCRALEGQVPHPPD